MSLSSSSSPPAATPSAGRWLARQIFAHRWLAGLAVVPLLLSTALVLSAGVVLRQVVDSGLGAGDGTALTFWTFVLLALVAGIALASWLRLYLSARLAEKVVGEIRRGLADRLIRTDPLAWRKLGGRVLVDFASDGEQLQTSLVVFLPMALRHLVLLLGGIILAIHTEPLLAGVLLLLLPVFFVPILLLARVLRHKERALRTETSLFGASLREAWQGLTTLRALDLTRYFASRHEAQLLEVASKEQSHGQARANLIATALGLALLVAVAVFWLGGQAVVAGTLSAGALSAFVFYAAVVAGAAGALGEVFGDLQRGVAAAGRLAELLALPTEPEEPEAGESYQQALPARGAPLALTIEDLSFRYPESDRLALDKVSFALEKGSFTALLGMSGAGKSTLFRLLWRLYEPAEGKILCEGTPLVQVSRSGWRRTIAVVEQDPALFSMSLRDNLLLGCKADEGAVLPSDEALVALLKKLGAESLLTRLPNGLDGVVAGGGAELSGGERQWIAIVRALLRRPALLLLDEASAGLDALSEDAFRRVLTGIYGETTLLVIAHRLSTVRRADKVVVLQAGKVLEEGTPDALIARQGAFAEFLRLQSFEGAKF